jgi:hypothetical protein
METGTFGTADYKKNVVVIKNIQLPHESLRMVYSLIEIRCGKVSLRMLDKSNKK